MPRGESGQRIPCEPRLSASPLLDRGGFVIVSNLFGADGFRLLLDEALSCYGTSVETNVCEEDREEVRGGNPARRFLSCAAGPIQDHYYHAPAITSWLHGLTGLAVRPTGRRGTYTYYVREGDYLALHRDVPGCDLALITCLIDSGGDRAGGGTTDLYPDRCREPLSRVRASLDDGRLTTRLAPGESMVLLGGVVPHAIRPIERGQQRVISVLCYRTE